MPFSLLGMMCLSSLSLFSQEATLFKHIPSPSAKDSVEIALVDSVAPQIDSTMFIVRDLDEILSSLGTPDFERRPVNKVLAPWVFYGYHRLTPKVFGPASTEITGLTVLTNDTTRQAEEEEINLLDYVEDESMVYHEPEPDVDILHPDVAPKWLRDALTSYRIQEYFIYQIMLDNPMSIEKAYWDLPERPRLPEDDVTFAAYIRKLNLPEVDPTKAALPDKDIRKIHWLHNVNTALQFSQAYVSTNWYQGGNNHLSLLFNFAWNVQLNPVYHPNLLFQSNLAYKLGLNSTPQDEVHKYSISEDLLQYNLNTGFKAFKKWFYSMNVQFKTQLLRNYEKNSMKRKASFLSPGDLNVGLGMAYSTQNKKKTFQLTATISPLSYNLKTCITDSIDHGRFNIAPDKKTHSEIGSNGEVNMKWNILWNITYQSRIFLFTDYKYFQGDWENTISFNINKFLSTQIYAHLRYDTSVPSHASWKKFMLREILSFGLSYTFSTKP